MNKFTVIHEIEDSEIRIAADIRYWLENLEKKFVYNLCSDKYKLTRAGVDDIIERHGLQDVGLDTETDD